MSQKHGVSPGEMEGDNLPSSETRDLLKELSEAAGGGHCPC